MEKQLGFFFDASACSGCKTCQVACKDKNDLPMGIRWRRVYEVSGGEWVQQGKAWVPEIFSWHVSMACNHCQDAICLKSCPNKAITRNELGVVLIDARKCMGCRYCEWTCPYGALQFDPEQKVMTKCNFCIDYLEQGQAPACVAACPMRALDFGELEALRERYGSVNEVFPLPQKNFTDPALVVKPHPGTRISQKHQAQIANIEEVR
ncbi:MAG: DMSO/selenate family reductase complex B subunit [Bacteroidales bacterium]|jgi:anaerobic dimethyl sulfoxide reductase subunit B (iron-sulfur subunit)|nr:DMSO/selenate family reductase complex B subunit [Bacteroidales bacterium]NLM92251.1 dimethylsulfoxide reductase subunit B [Bacteroidales bacterium]